MAHAALGLSGDPVHARGLRVAGILLLCVNAANDVDSAPATGHGAGADS
jgi:hypothetical protein